MYLRDWWRVRNVIGQTDKKLGNVYCKHAAFVRLKIKRMILTVWRLPVRRLKPADVATNV